MNVMIAMEGALRSVIIQWDHSCVDAMMATSSILMGSTAMVCHAIYNLEKLLLCDLLVYRY